MTDTERITQLEKDLKNLRDEVERLKKSKSINNIFTVDKILTGTVASGDTTTDNIINDIRTKLDRIIVSGKGQ